MDSNRQKFFLGLVLIPIVLLIVYAQLRMLWPILQLPIDEILHLADTWHILGMILFLPSLAILVILSSNLIEIEAREFYQKPLTFNLFLAGTLQLFAVWQAYQVESIKTILYLILAVFSFSLPFLIKKIGIKNR